MRLERRSLVGRVGRWLGMGRRVLRGRITLGWVVAAVGVLGVLGVRVGIMGRVVVGVLRGSMRRLRVVRVVRVRVVWWWW